ncbi:hypothetical protein F5Y19DRAFT_457914 [Xylariaceae sp. FL1651]|nr:hypothetical protein F5Y19DRAFT_457914 [Xylariaceae sp. FL1651]
MIRNLVQQMLTLRPLLISVDYHNKVVSRSLITVFQLNLAMASSTDLKADRVQRKRVQNREAQQKYRTRVKERMNALEKQIKELKTQAKAPEVAFEEQEQLEHAVLISPPNPLLDLSPPDSFHAPIDWFWEQTSTANENMASRSLKGLSPDTDITPTPSSTSNHEHILLPLQPPASPDLDLVGALLLSDDTNVSERQLHSYVELKNKLQGQTLEKRLEFLHLCLTSAGFETFDSMISQYYTSTLSPETIVFSHQRTSRQRDLPVLLAELRRYVRTWTQWEVHGYCYEIIKSVESIVDCERGAANIYSVGAEFGDPIRHLIKEPDVGLGGASLSSVLQAMMRGFQKTNPKLWALLESLVDSGEAITNQRQRFCTTLALMLLLSPPKQVSGRQMVTILMNCVHMIYDNSK